MTWKQNKLFAAFPQVKGNNKLICANKKEMFIKRKQNAVEGLDLLLHIKSKIIANYAAKSGMILLYCMFKKKTLYMFHQRIMKMTT